MREGKVKLNKEEKDKDKKRMQEECGGKSKGRRIEKI